MPITRPDGPTDTVIVTRVATFVQRTVEVPAGLDLTATAKWLEENWTDWIDTASMPATHQVALIERPDDPDTDAYSIARRFPQLDDFQTASPEPEDQVF